MQYIFKLMTWLGCDPLQFFDQAVDDIGQDSFPLDVAPQKDPGELRQEVDPEVVVEPHLARRVQIENLVVRFRGKVLSKI